MKNVAGSWELGGGEVGSRHWQGRRQVTIDFSSHSLVTTVSKDAAQALFALQLFFDDVKSMAIQDDSSIGSNVTRSLDLNRRLSIRQHAFSLPSLDAFVFDLRL